MKTNREQGNALIYVLIAIALFAALSMTLGRQTDTGEAGSLSDERAELYATQLISYSAQAKSSVDQMLFSGAKIEDPDFTLPNSTGFEAGVTADKIKRVYHPDGGGLIASRMPEEAKAYSGTDPGAGWYMGRFNNVEWTASTDTDVILVAYGINKKICENINEKVRGTKDIPALETGLRVLFVDDDYHTGSNTDITTETPGSPNCADCHKQSALCVKDNVSEIYGFYTIIADR